MDDNTLMIRRNAKPVQKIDRQRGYMYTDGARRELPSASDTLLSAVLPSFKINQ